MLLKAISKPIVYLACLPVNCAAAVVNFCLPGMHPENSLQNRVQQLSSSGLLAARVSQFYQQYRAGYHKKSVRDILKELSRAIQEHDVAKAQLLAPWVSLQEVSHWIYHTYSDEMFAALIEKVGLPKNRDGQVDLQGLTVRAVERLMEKFPEERLQVTECNYHATFDSKIFREPLYVKENKENPLDIFLQYCCYFRRFHHLRQFPQIVRQVKFDQLLEKGTYTYQDARQLCAIFVASPKLTVKDQEKFAQWMLQFLYDDNEQDDEQKSYAWEVLYAAGKGSELLSYGPEVQKVQGVFPENFAQTIDPDFAQRIRDRLPAFNVWEQFLNSVLESESD